MCTNIPISLGDNSFCKNSSVFKEQITYAPPGFTKRNICCSIGHTVPSTSTASNVPLSITRSKASLASVLLFESTPSPVMRSQWTHLRAGRVLCRSLMVSMHPLSLSTLTISPNSRENRSSSKYNTYRKLLHFTSCINQTQ
jgi:hypothetical protein